MKQIVLFLSFFLCLNLQAQESPLFTGKARSFKVISPISGKQNLKPAIVKGEAEDGRSSKNKVIIGKDPQKTNDWLAENKNPLTNKLKTRDLDLVFVGAESSSMPTDPSLAVGPDHVFFVFNTGFRVYDKQGNALTEELAPSAIFGEDGCCDLTVSYDNLAQRWVASLLDTSAGTYVAVSSTADPVNSEWYVWNYAQVSDYQKLSVWSDGYYMTDNTSSTNNVYAFEREKMLEGDADAQIIAFPLTGLVKDGFYSPQAFNVSTDNYPAAGNAPIVFLQDDAWSGVSEDHLKIWTINVDWTDTDNSTISEPTELVTTPFVSVFDGGSFTNLTQPNSGTDIDALQSTIMNQAQFRKFSDHNSAVFSFVVNTDVSGGELAGIRWYELRQSADGEAWEIYQEGTYTAPDNKHAWCGSLGIDVQGNIGLGYVGMGGDNETFVSSYYTGRRVNDPLNTMTFEESVIMEGNGNIPETRFGDYGKLDLDPADGKKFWFTSELYNDARKQIVGEFQLAPNYDNDLGVVSIDSPETGALSSTESVTVTIYNYGELEQSNFPVSLSLDGTLIATETYTGTLASGETAQYTFSATVDLGTEGQTYTIASSTGLSTDEDESNDETSAEVTHLYTNDVGVTAIVSPETGSSLGEQSFVVTIENYGSQTQTDIPVYYSVNGGANVVENFTGSLAAGETVDYTFTTTYNFSTFGEFSLMAGTQLSDDSVDSNDSVEKDIINLSCIDGENSESIDIVDNETVTSVITIDESALINDVNVTLNITHTWDADLGIVLTAPDGTEVNLVNRRGSLGDNFTNTVLDDDADTAIADGSAPFTGVFKPEEPLSAFNGLNMQGDWTLSVTDNATLDSGTLDNWTLTICSDDLLSSQEFSLNNTSFDVVHISNKLYLVQMNNTEIQGKVNLEVYNMEGKLLLSRRLENNGGSFSYDLDMSYAAPGVYIVRMNNKKVNATKRIIVK